MSHATQVSARPVRSGAGLGGALRRLAHALVGAWRHAVARREFDSVDANTLRDLGMSRSEFDSYWAESSGWAEPTRVRVRQEICAKGRS